jgi:hypothetical protein
MYRQHNSLGFTPELAAWDIKKTMNLICLKGGTKLNIRHSTTPLNDNFDSPHSGRVGLDNLEKYHLKWAQRYQFGHRRHRHSHTF